MSRQQMNLVYQAYGRTDILRQTLFSLVSLYHSLSKPGHDNAERPTSSIQVVVYTDQPHIFRDFFGVDWMNQNRLIIVEITPEQIKKWRGAIDFVHRVKVEVLIDAAKKFQGSLFYVDGDTYFNEDPTAIFSEVDNQHSLMHVAEYRFRDGHDPLAKKILKFIKRNHFKVAGESIQMNADQFMYNAGAIGLSEENRQWLPLILELTDTMFVTYGKHVIEQLAFSYYLQTRSKIVTADKQIGHYWNQKDEFQSAIDDFLNRHPRYADAKVGYPNSFHWPQPPPIISPRRSSIAVAIARLFAGS